MDWTAYSPRPLDRLAQGLAGQFSSVAAEIVDALRSSDPERRGMALRHVPMVIEGLAGNDLLVALAAWFETSGEARPEDLISVCARAIEAEMAHTIPPEAETRVATLAVGGQ